MRTLVIMRGIPGSGKSTFIENHQLKPFTLSPDDFRLHFQAPLLTEENGYDISHKNEKKVWNHLYALLEERMKRGDFTVVDATHKKARDFTQYKALAEAYRYHVVCVDLSHVSLEQAKEWNAQRPSHKRVSDALIEKHHQQVKDADIPKWVKVIRPEAFEQTVRIQPIDFSHYKKVHMIGDIHGCYTALTSYLATELPNDELFIFCGDYVDRGIQNGQTLDYLFTLMHRKNVIFLEGNHEIHLWKYANDLPSYSKKEFERYTKADLNEARISKKTLRAFYRQLRQLVYFTYGEKTVLVTHGGLPSIPEQLVHVSTEQLIKGVGDYSTEIDKIFTANTDENSYQVHGHRNVHSHPVQAAKRSFNLEGSVESGGHLRVVVLDNTGFTPIEIKNNVFSERFALNKNQQEFTNQDFLESLREDELVYEKELGDNISSFNFKREVFTKSMWNSQNIKARGLFINTETTEIVARSYDKSFNIDSYLDNPDGKLY